MKYSILFCLLVSQILAGDLELWNQWKLKFNKVYENEVEESHRFRIWKNMLEMVKDHNVAYDLGLTTFDMEVNEFSDMTSEEFAAARFGRRPTTGSYSVDQEISSPQDNVPNKQDWRPQGYVTPIKDQKQCGSCWAFSSTGGLEGQHFNATGKLVSLSEQELVDCDNKCYGCGGGNVNLAFDHWIREGGAVYESDYPYKARNEKCKRAGKPIAATLRSYNKIRSRDENDLKNKVGLVGPISIAIDAGHPSFQSYRSGIYHEPFCSQERLDHAVLAVGYGSEGPEKDYWIVKNSWGTSWGQKGYIWMSRNRNNNCGVATDAYYPIV